MLRTGMALVFAGGFRFCLARFLAPIRKGSAALIDLGLFNNRIFSDSGDNSISRNGMLIWKAVSHSHLPDHGRALSATTRGLDDGRHGGRHDVLISIDGHLTERFGCRGFPQVERFGSVFHASFLWMIQYGFFSSLDG